jgi:hypothetical protein
MSVSPVLSPKAVYSMSIFRWFAGGLRTLYRAYWGWVSEKPFTSTNAATSRFVSDLQEFYDCRIQLAGLPRKAALRLLVKQ